MTAKNYKTGEDIGTVTSIDEAKYEAFVESDNTGTGAVRAGDWLSEAELQSLGIKSDLVVFFE